MKQRIYLLMVLMAAAIAFGACSSGDDDENLQASIVGTWVRYEDGIFEEDLFNADGTCQSYTGNPTTVYSRFRNTGTYSISGNKLTFHWTKTEIYNSLTETWTTEASEDEVTITFSIDGDKMTIYSTTADYEISEPIVMTRENSN